ncbi:MAG TPA: hypothetical protein VNM14_00860 [Planctomycetota bacterium]|jgi:hypothetical protein|nr:hypothetical protein [Planctomycetota bacterium]
MIRQVWVVLLLGCASASPREEGPLDRLITKSNAYTSFHLRGEISDGKASVPVEMAFKAPDRALLKYGSVATTILSGGRTHYFLRNSYASVHHVEIIDSLRAKYPKLEIGPAPEAVFSLGDGVRAMLAVGRLGARLGWLEELKTYKAEAGVYRHGQTEIQLRDDGFIERTSIGGHGFILKDVAVNTALPDSLFELPPTAGLQGPTARQTRDFVHTLDEAYHRWVLETSTSDETLNGLVSVDLAAKYEPEKMAELLRESVLKSLKAFRTLKPDAQPDAMKHKIEIERGKAMGNVDIMEEEIQKDYEKALDGYFRGMAVVPPQKEMLDVARRWHAAVKKQVDEQIRRRFDAVLAGASEPQKE